MSVVISNDFSQYKTLLMLDYWKLWITDEATITSVINNPLLEFEYRRNADGDLKKIYGKWINWDIVTLSPSLLQITGSIHKYWNNGSNENDFSFDDNISAIQKFCCDFNLDPSLAHVKNLEFGVNLQVKENASHIINQIICYNCSLPIRPYENTPNRMFIEFKHCDYYLKVYDKGKQYRNILPATPNTLRIEVKAMNNRFLNFANILTLEDLTSNKNLHLLGMKLDTLSNGLIFDDNTIDSSALNNYEKKLYNSMINPRIWTQHKGNRKSTLKKQINRFKELVDTKGQINIYSLISQAIKDKIKHLDNRKVASFIPNIYTMKSATSMHK